LKRRGNSFQTIARGRRYAAVLGSDQPQCLPELMSYQYEIANFARKYKQSSWVVYDMNYRQEAAYRPFLSWAEAAGHREAQFFPQCFNGDPNDAWCRTCQSLEYSTRGCPTRSNHTEILSPHSQKFAKTTIQKGVSMVGSLAATSAPNVWDSTLVLNALT